MLKSVGVGALLMAGCKALDPSRRCSNAWLSSLFGLKDPGSPPHPPSQPRCLIGMAVSLSPSGVDEHPGNQDWGLQQHLRDFFRVGPAAPRRTKLLRRHALRRLGRCPLHASVLLPALSRRSWPDKANEALRTCQLSNSLPSLGFFHQK